MSSPKRSEDPPIVILPQENEAGDATIPAVENNRAPSGAASEAAIPVPPESESRSAARARTGTGPLSLVGGGAALLVLASFVAVGFFVIRGEFFVAYYPEPGKLSASHAEVRGAPDPIGCTDCHADSGLPSGCLTCHEEIARQLGQRVGFHHFLLKGKTVECRSCHREHVGRDTPLVDDRSWNGWGPEGFRHEHVASFLEGKHAALRCEECHETKRKANWALPRFPLQPRSFTYLGLEQECVFCHEDVHSGGLSRDCESCHDQNTWRPAPHFDHSEYFPLAGGHAGVSCDGCHVISEGSRGDMAALPPFEKVRGTKCSQCHQSPHRAPFESPCEDCHNDSSPSWAMARESLTADLHALTGFRVDRAHAEVACDGCHDPELAYEERYPDPSAEGYLRRPETCGGCHPDVHGNQFEFKYPECLDCHSKLRFLPHRYDRERHGDVYPLVDAHAEVRCASCHKVDVATKIRQFAGTSRECEGCHEDPHDGRFRDAGRQCTECHDMHEFLPASFGQAQHELVYPLRGSHQAVPCRSCHVVDEATNLRMLAGTPSQCQACHQDPHGEQFAEELLKGDCTACHSEACDTFSVRPFDHQKLAGYALIGAHQSAACDLCHVKTAATASSPTPVRRYRGTSTSCSSCHADVHRGQFQSGRSTKCSDCHESTVRWADIGFDHDTQSRFPLEGAHSSLECTNCHPRVRLPDGVSLVQYKPLGIACKDCHEIVSR